MGGCVPTLTSLAHAKTKLYVAGVSIRKIPEAVRAVTEDYVPTDDTAAGRLNAALTVMVYAYTACLYKKEADKRFQMIKEKHYDC